MKITPALGARLSAVILSMAVSSYAGPFTNGNVAVLQADASANNTTASIVELQPTAANQTPTNTIPIDGTTLPNALRFSGSATSTAYIANSQDGTLLVFTGHNSTNSGVNANTLLTRGVGTLNNAGTFNLATTYTGASGNQTRCATTINNTTWFVGDQGGIYTNGTSSASPSGNFRGVKAFGGSVYVAQSSATVTIIQVSTLSAATGGTLTGLPGLANNANLQDFYLVSSGANGATFDVLYTLSSTTNTAGTIAKYSLVSGSWVANGSYTTTFGGFGLAAAASGGTGVLYVTTGAGAQLANQVLRVTDTAGYNATLNIVTANNVVLYTAPTGKIIKGVAFSPIVLQPDLTVSVAAPATATGGINFDYTITASNSGVANASGVAVNFTLPAGLNFVSASGTSGFTASQSAGVVSFTGGTLNAGATATMTVNVNTNVAGTYTAAVGAAVIDPANTIAESNESNNTSATAASTVVSAGIPVVTITTTDALAAESPADAGTFRFSRTGDLTNALSVSYTIASGAGRAVAADYTPALSGTVSIPASQSFVDVTITPVDDILLEGDETVQLTLVDTVDYDLGANVTTTVTITDNETAIDLTRYVRIGRYDLPEPTRTAAPSGSLLAQEASSVTYNWDTDTLFVCGDGGTSVVQVSKTGVLIDSMSLATGSSPQGTTFYDTEGITYVGGGQFVMTEERDRQLFKFTYVAGTTLTRGAAQTVKIGTTIGNVGLEGLCWDPQTSGFIVVKEKDPRGIFQTGVDFAAGTATNGSPTTVNSVDLFNPALISVLDHSDIFALSNLPALNGKPTAGDVLLLSQESGQIVHLDRSGNTLSTLTIVAPPGSPLTVPDMTTEGVTMDRDGVLYIVNENGGGDSAHPQLWVYAPSNAANLAPTAVTLTNVVTSLPETTNTTAAVRVADIGITDDGIGTNALSLSGADAASFEIVGTALFLKAGTALSATTKPVYSISVGVDDTTVGSTPDASTTYALTITSGAGGTPNLIISEVAPWSSTNGLGLTADWFEVTNIGTAAVNITGWKMDDNSNSFAVAVPMGGITSIAPGESVIFIETATPADLSTKAAAFRSLWFGASPPSGLQIGYYSGSGVGLSTSGDAVNVFDAGGTLQAKVTFGTAPGTAPFATFDNAAGLNNAAISTLAVIGTNGAFAATGDVNEIGSPGTISGSSTPIINITASDANAAETASDPGTFRITRSGSTASSLTVNYTIATGAGQATGSDYTPALSGSLSIPAGLTFADITITPVDDALVEGAETLTLTLFDTGSYDVGANATATVTITDNDSANLPPTAVVLSNTVTTLSENASTASDVRVADISITDDGMGTNTLSLSGADAASFLISGNALYLKAGTTLSFATKSSYAVTVNVDDTTVGTTPDATVNFTLAVTPYIAPGSIIITEVSPWSSTAANSPLAADWFEVTNRGSSTVNLAGWKVDDNSHAFGSAVALNGITSIAPGESVIFIETATPAAAATTFRNLWFGASPPSGLQIGSYTGSGIGLGSTGDEVVLFDGSGARITGVGFGASSASAPFRTFDNTANVTGTTDPLPTITTLSTVGYNGAFAAATDANEIGSPGTATASTPVSTWRQSFFGTSSNTGLTANNADYDGDGIVNLMEYALGLNPTTGSGANGLAALPQGSTQESNSLLSDRMALVFDTSSSTPADLTYTVQATDDLITWTNVATKSGSGAWTWVGGGTSHIVLVVNGARTTVKVGDVVANDASHPRRMMQLVVTSP